MSSLLLVDKAAFADLQPQLLRLSANANRQQLACVGKNRIGSDKVAEFNEWKTGWPYLSEEITEQLR